MTLAFRSSWCSVKLAMRSSTSSRKPPSWPARTMLTDKSLKACGCIPIASARLMPSATLMCTSRSTSVSAGCDDCRARISRLRNSGTPARSRSASWAKKLAMCRAFTLRVPPPIVADAFLASSMRSGNRPRASSIVMASCSLPAVSVPVLRPPALVIASKLKSGIGGILVPRLCLGTLVREALPRGPSRNFACHATAGRQSLPTVRSQAEPGTEMASTQIRRGGPGHFLDSGQSFHNLAPAVLPQRDHAFLERFVADHMSVGPLHHQFLDAVAGEHQLEDAHAAAVAGLPALAAAGAFPKLLRVLALGDAGEVAGHVAVVRLIFHFAFLADIAHQPLRHDSLDGARHEERLHAHIDQSREGAWRIVGVQGAEHQVTGERRLNGVFGCLQVADFADQDHVRVVPQDAAQRRAERQADLGVDLNLADVRLLVFDGVFDGDNFRIVALDLVERAIERGALAGARRTGDQDDAVRAIDDFAE